MKKSVLFLMFLFSIFNIASAFSLGTNILWVTSKNVGIGTTTPVYLFSVSGTANATSFVGAWNGTTIPVAKGGTGATTLTGILKGNGTGAFTAITDNSINWNNYDRWSGTAAGLDVSQAMSSLGLGSLSTLSTITSTEIQNGTILAEDILSGEITSTLIAPNAITNVKMADNSIGAAEIIDGAIGSADLASNSVTSAKIFDGTIVAADMSTGSYSNITGVGTLGALTVAGTANITRSYLISGTTVLSAGALGTGVTTSYLTSFGSSPTFITPILGTPTSGTLTNCTGLSLTSGVTGVLPIANGGTGSSTILTARSNLGLGNGDSPSFEALSIGGATISAWNSVFKPLSIGTQGATIFGATNSSKLAIASNAAFNTSWKYVVNGVSSVFQIDDASNLLFSTAPYGTAGNDISFTDIFIVTNTGSVGVGTTTPSSTSILELSSTTKSFLPTRMTTTQKNAISSPSEGSVLYDLTLHKLCVYTGSTWETVTSL